MSTPAKTFTLHALVSGVTVPTDSDAGTVLFRGQWVTLDADAIERTKDRLGNSWLDEDEAAQLKRFGEVRWMPGLPPADIGIGLDDHAAAANQRAADEKNLAYISDPEEREAAAQAILAKYGRRTTQRTIVRG